MRIQRIQFKILSEQPDDLLSCDFSAGVSALETDP